MCLVVWVAEHCPSSPVELQKKCNNMMICETEDKETKTFQTLIRKREVNMGWKLLNFSMWVKMFFLLKALTKTCI